MTEIKKGTCNKLRDLIVENLDMSVYKFAKEIGLSRPTITAILKDSDTQPTLLTIKRICKYFNVDFKDYL